jgi:hypothetical protein
MNTEQKQDKGELFLVLFFAGDPSSRGPGGKVGRMVLTFEKGKPTAHGSGKNYI